MGAGRWMTLPPLTDSPVKASTQSPAGRYKPGWPDFPDRGLAAVRQVLG